jgi:hypothetical protein
MTQVLKTPPQHRIQLEDVYQDYQDGLLTAKGAVFYGVAASKRFGLPVQFNVSEFLKQTGMHKGSYARAVAQLVVEGRLDYPPNATQTLRVPIDAATKQPIYYSLSETRSQICSDRSQICDRSEQICDRPQQICDRQSPEVPPVNESESSLYYYSSINRERENECEDSGSEFDEWLTRKAMQLPTPPTLLEEWLEKNRVKKSNRKQFLKYKKAVREASVPQPAAPAIFEVESEDERRLALLNFWWEDGSQERVKATIAAHPEWRLVVTASGVEARER